MKYIVRSCKGCNYYAPEKDDQDTCIRCRRYYEDFFEKKEAED